MSSDVPSKDQYDAFAALYANIETLPHIKLAEQLVLRALEYTSPDEHNNNKTNDSNSNGNGNDNGNSKLIKILDLGGGTGLHARNAIKHLRSEDGKTEVLVDNVDVSAQMLEICRRTEEERSAGRDPHRSSPSPAEGSGAGETEGSRIRCFLGDATEPGLASKLQLLEPANGIGTQGYDIVMVNWTFDHATTLTELRAIWADVGELCRPDGGKLIGIMSTDPRVPRPEHAKYGVVMTDLRPERDPDGEEGEDVACSVKYTALLEEPFTGEARLLRDVWDLDRARQLAGEVGFEGLRVVPVAEMEIVRKDPGFWREFVEDPGYVCVVGFKRQV